MKENPKKAEDDKSIAELEADLVKLHKKVVQQTTSVKSLLQKSLKKEPQPTTAPLMTKSSEPEPGAYTMDQAQAEFFAAIATLDKIISNFQEGKIDAPVYNQQLKLLLQDIYKFKLFLEKNGYDIAEFINKENILTKFTNAYQKLKNLGILM